jgi:LPXTG-motif cell wall-anchored protein
MRRVLTSLLLATLGAMLAVGLMASAAFAQEDTPPVTTPEVGGITVTRTDGVDVGGSSTGRLPFTGSSDDTPSLVLIGLSAIAVGGVIVIGARRRQAVLQRA